MQKKIMGIIRKSLLGAAIVVAPLSFATSVLATETVKNDQLVNPSHEQLMHYSFNMNRDQLNAAIKEVCPDSLVMTKVTDPTEEGGKVINDITAEKCVAYAGDKRTITFHYKGDDFFYTIIDIGTATGGDIPEKEGITGIAELDSVLTAFNSDPYYKPVKQTPAAKRKAFNAGEEDAKFVKFYFENTASDIWKNVGAQIESLRKRTICNQKVRYENSNQ